MRSSPSRRSIHQVAGVLLHQIARAAVTWPFTNVPPQVGQFVGSGACASVMRTSLQSSVPTGSAPVASNEAAARTPAVGS